MKQLIKKVFKSVGIIIFFICILIIVIGWTISDFGTLWIFFAIIYYGEKLNNNKNEEYNKVYKWKNYDPLKGGY